MALKDNALVTVAELKAYLKRTDATDDSLFEILINSVSEFFDLYAGFQLKKKTYTDLLLDGNGAVEFWLPFYPVDNITSLKEIDSVGSEETLTEGKNKDYIVDKDKGLLIRRDEKWYDDYDSIKITCDGGFATIPDDLKIACYIKVAIEYCKTTQKSWGETSRSFPDGSVSMMSQEEAEKFVYQILDRYKKIII